MISQGEGCREDVGGGGWKHTRQTLEKSPTSKRYTTWAHILSNRNVFASRGGGTAGSNAPGAFLVTPPSGRGLVIPIFFPWFFFFFLVVTCPRPPVFARPNKYSSCLSLHRQGLLS